MKSKPEFALPMATILFLFLSTIFISKAQNPIPNPGFEDWSGGEPVGWHTINQNVLGSDFICVTRDQTNKHSGTSSAKIETITQNIIFVGPVTMPGILSLGEITLDIINQTGSVSGGVPIDTQPNALRGWYRYQPSAGDSCIMGIGLSRWNGNSRDTLAYAYTVIGSTTTAWTEFTVPVEYLIWAVPDTMNIMFFSSNLLNGSPVSGSKLWVDDLTLEYGPVGAHTQLLQPLLKFNADRTLTITRAAGSTEATIYTLTGSYLAKFQLNAANETNTINAEFLKPGIYILTLRQRDGRYNSVKLAVP